MFATVTKAIQKAESRYKETGIHQAIVELDEGEGRCIRIVPASYVDSDEFEAFEGSVIYLTDDHQ